MASSSQEMRDADDLSRKELQTELKRWGLPSSGTNAALRQRYSSELEKKRSLSQLQPQHGKSLTPTKLWSMPTCLPVGTAAPAAPYSSPVSNTKNKKLPPEEKRLKRYRSFAPAAVQQRISRAKTQRMYLIKRGDIQHGQEGATCSSCQFVVLGSTGNVYTVAIQNVPNCTCPDHARGNLCKHILFVLLKVMSIDSQSPLIFQAAWLESELRDMFAQFEARLRHLSGASASAIMANATVRKAFAKMEQGHDLEEIVKDTKVARKAVEEDDCPICFDAMSSSEATTFCRARCGKCDHFLEG
jgi:hypothetical protein